MQSKTSFLFLSRQAQEHHPRPAKARVAPLYQLSSFSLAPNFQHPLSPRLDLPQQVDFSHLFAFGSDALLIESPSLSCTTRRQAPGEGLPKLDSSCEIHDCLLHFTGWLRLPGTRSQCSEIPYSFWGPMFQSNSHKPVKLQHNSPPILPVTTLYFPDQHPLMGAVKGLSYPSICNFSQYHQIRISALWLTEISSGA